jgi:glycosyltransferase involved in cell wall biosynthesis
MVGPKRRALADVDLHLSLVIPLHNEEPNVAPLHEELARVLRSMGVGYEILLIDDGSTDGTFAKLVALHAADPQVRVIRFAGNFGQTAAFAAGFARARGQFIITFDGDMQNDPADIPRLLELARSHDIVCGWRKDRKDDFLTRHVPSVVANWLLGVVSGIRIHDNGCSLKVFRAGVVKPLRLRPGMHRYLPALASQLGGRVTEVVVNHRPRQFGQSKYGLSRTFRVITDLVRLRGLMREAVNPATETAGLYEVASILESRSDSATRSAKTV